jgi:hypothetical protein
MIQILLSSIALSIIHAAIPNHWMPLVAIGNSEHWNMRETLTATGLAGLAHVLSTIIIGIGVGWAGYALYSEYEWVIYSIAPAILIILGIIYLVWNHNHRHDHFHGVAESTGSKVSVIGSLVVAMFFSPCLELETYYFTAGMYGWEAIILVSAIYLIVTVSGMMLFVYLGLKGLQRFNLKSFEEHEKAITGWILILIGIITLVMNI